MISSMTSSTYETQVARTRQRFVLSLNDRLDVIVTELHCGLASESRESHSRKIHRLLHDMAGNSAMLELSAIDSVVRKGVTVAEAADGDGRDLTDVEKAEIAAVIDEARAIAADLAAKI